MTKVTAEINHQLEQVVAELEAALAQGRPDFFLVRRAGGIAGLLDRPDLVSRLETVMSHLTVEDVFRAAITNLDEHEREVRATRLFRFESPEEISRQHPECDDASIIDRMKAQADVHVLMCLKGDVHGATETATSKLALEDIGCTLAAMGQFERATAFIDSQAVEDTSRAAVRHVILLEKCRRGHAGIVEVIQLANLQGEGRLRVVLALAGRLPWVGYPYSDW